MTSPSSEDGSAPPSPPKALIRARRRKAQLSQEAFAERVGVTPRQVKRWEAGDNLPTPESASRIAKVIGGDAEDYTLPEMSEFRAAMMQGTWSPIDVVSDDDRAFWQDVMVGSSMSDEQVAEKWGLPDVEAVHGRRRRIAAEVARHPLVEARAAEQFDALKRATSRRPQRLDDRLAALEAKVDAMAQATAESLASLAMAIDELSARIPQAKPGSRRRKAAGE
jgi:transcriptional regulator with XRE-family HTH domain